MQGIDTQAGIRLDFCVVIFDFPALKKVPASMMARKTFGCGMTVVPSLVEVL